MIPGTRRARRRRVWRQKARARTKEKIETTSMEKKSLRPHDLKVFWRVFRSIPLADTVVNFVGPTGEDTVHEICPYYRRRVWGFLWVGNGEYPTGKESNNYWLAPRIRSSRNEQGDTYPWISYRVRQMIEFQGFPGKWNTVRMMDEGRGVSFHGESLSPPIENGNMSKEEPIDVSEGPQVLSSLGWYSGEVLRKDVVFSWKPHPVRSLLSEEISALYLVSVTKTCVYFLDTEVKSLGFGMGTVNAALEGIEHQQRLQLLHWYWKKALSLGTIHETVAEKLMDKRRSHIRSCLSCANETEDIDGVPIPLEISLWMRGEYDIERLESGPVRSDNYDEWRHRMGTPFSCGYLILSCIKDVGDLSLAPREIAEILKGDRHIRYKEFVQPLIKGKMWEDLHNPELWRFDGDDKPRDEAKEETWKEIFKEETWTMIRRVENKGVDEKKGASREQILAFVDEVIKFDVKKLEARAKYGENDDLIRHLVSKRGSDPVTFLHDDNPCPEDLIKISRLPYLSTAYIYSHSARILDAIVKKYEIQGENGDDWISKAAHMIKYESTNFRLVLKKGYTEAEACLSSPYGPNFSLVEESLRQVCKDRVQAARLSGKQ